MCVCVWRMLGHTNTGQRRVCVLHARAPAAKTPPGRPAPSSKRARGTLCASQVKKSTSTNTCVCVLPPRPPKTGSRSQAAKRVRAFRRAGARCSRRAPPPFAPNRRRLLLPSPPSSLCFSLSRAQPQPQTKKSPPKKKPKLLFFPGAAGAQPVRLSRQKSPIRIHQINTLEGKKLIRRPSPSHKTN